MRNLRTYYSAPISEFLRRATAEIIGVIHSNDISAETTIQQSNTWEIEVAVLKDHLRFVLSQEKRKGPVQTGVALYSLVLHVLYPRGGGSWYCSAPRDAHAPENRLLYPFDPGLSFGYAEGCQQNETVKENRYEKTNSKRFIGKMRRGPFEV